MKKNLRKKLSGVKEKVKEHKVQRLERKQKKKEKRVERKEKRKERRKNKLRGCPISKSFPLMKAVEFIENSIEKREKSEKSQLYDPFEKKLEFDDESNHDKICFHFTLAKPMESVSIKGATTFYHWFNVYIFLDGDIIMSELDWEVVKDEEQEEEEKKKWQRIEECIHLEKYPDYMDYLDLKKTVLVQDLEDEEGYPSSTSFLCIEKEELKKVIKSNPLIGKPYDFTGGNHCQNWCKFENEGLGLGSKFSCKFVNEFFNSRKTLMVIGNIIKKMVISRMDSSSEEEEEGEKKKKKKRVSFVKRMKMRRKERKRRRKKN